MVDVQGIAADSLGYGAGTLTLYENHVHVAALAFSGAASTPFGLASDGHGGTDIVGRASPYAFVSAPEHSVPAGADRIMTGLFGHELPW